MAINLKNTSILFSLMLLSIPAQLQASSTFSSRDVAVYGSFAALGLGAAALVYSYSKRSALKEIAQTLKADSARAKKESLREILQTEPGYSIQVIEKTKDFGALKDIPHAPQSRKEVSGRGFILYQNAIPDITPEDIPVGYISYKRLSSHVSLQYLGIKKSSQGLGLGTFLVRYVMCLIANEGPYKEITLTAVSSQKIDSLKRFYEKLGFARDHNSCVLLSWMEVPYIFSNRIVGISSDTSAHITP